MLRSAALWRAVLQRSRSDWPVVLAAWLLLLCATTLLATGALYAETVAAGGVRRALLDAPPDERMVRSRTTAASAADVPALDGPVRGAMETTIARVGGEVVTILRSGSFASAGMDPDEVDELTYLAAFGGLEGHATLLEGEWPRPDARRLQAALPAPAAEALGVGVGGSLSLVSRLDESVAVDLVVTGLYRVDPDDAYWAGEVQEIEGVQVSSPYTTVGPVVMTREDLLGVPGRVEVEWRALPAIEAMEVDDVEPLRVDIGQLDERFRAALPGRQLSLDASLPQRLADVGRSVVVGRSGVALLTIQFAVLAGYAIVLVGGLLLERRRSEVALLRSRGATSLHLLVMALVEGLVLAAAAVALAPLLAAGIVRLLAESGPLAEAGIGRAAGITPTSVLVAVAAGVAGVVALALPTLGSSVSLSGVRATIGRQAGSTLPQRLGIDLALVAVAGIAIWQLRLYGAPLTRNARGALGVDPLLVAAPAIGLLGGAVLALRIVPRVAELGQRLLERRRGLVAPLGGRQLARRPLRYTRAALLLMLAAGLATFATAHAATWTRSQRDQAAYRAASDVRVTAGDEGPSSLAAAGAYRAVPGVESATPVARLDIDLGRNIRGAPLLGVDPEAAARVIAQQAGATDATTRAALSRLAAEPPPPLPAAIPGTPSRLSVVVDAAIRQEEADPPYDGVLPPDYRGVTPSVVVEDGEGRLHRIAGEPGLLNGEGQRLVVDLAAAVSGTPAELGGVAPPTADPVWPLSLVAVDLGLTVPRGVIGVGSVALRDVAASDAAGGDEWTSLGIDALAQPWRWLRSSSAARIAFEPEANGTIGLGLAVGLPPLFAEDPATLRVLSLPAEPSEVPVIVGRRFLEATGAEVGESLTATTAGLRLPIRIAGAVDDFPPLDPARPFAVVDAAAIERIRFAATGQVPRPAEWWLDVADGRSGEVADTLGQSAWDTEAIVEREALATSLAADPVSLGIIGALGLGAVAALVFAAIGFLVSATVSITERIGEFALLQALGLSRRQLSVWLSLESAFLLVVGLLAGSALGVLLAWLVLPFATLTETGAPAVPAPIVVIPWQAVVPTWILALALIALTVVLVRRQLPSVRISGVLRARDE